MSNITHHDTYTPVTGGKTNVLTYVLRSMFVISLRSWTLHNTYSPQPAARSQT